ncbi:MAG TPA: hypothetical protein VFB22_00160 [Candidatus Baltobacteraceae bacterium]|nr:hypothetical protein [Candidatus Baltobacteraceae bacterium]
MTWQLACSAAAAWTALAAGGLAFFQGAKHLNAGRGHAVRRPQLRTARATQSPRHLSLVG